MPLSPGRKASVQANPPASPVTDLMSSLTGGGHSLLLRFFESQHFSLFLCVSYLERYAGNIGIHFYLCNKIRSYPAHEIEFFLPQLVQLHVTVETESMALEDLLLDLCNDSTHCTLLVFWQLQAHLTELSIEPDSYGFQVCKRLYNKLQYLLFNVGTAPSHKLRENTYPAVIFSSVLAAGIGLPVTPQFIKPLVVSQGRKQRTHIFHIASRLLHSKSTSNVSTTRDKPALTSPPSPEGIKKTSTAPQPFSDDIYSDKSKTHSMPDLNTEHRPGMYSPSSPSSPIHAASNSGTPSRRAFSNPLRPEMEGVRLLKTNYFRCETQFVYALQSISTRLIQVPKQARQSALRVELALLNRDLPAEVDIPLLLNSGRGGHGRGQNRIVRISPSEATVLNSAEKVPFLLLVEYLRDDVDFDTSNEKNRYLLSNKTDRRYIFDLAYLHDQQKQEKNGIAEAEEEALADFGLATPVGEEDMGDMSVVRLYESKREVITQDALAASVSSLPLKAAALRESTSSPRASDLSFASSYAKPAQESTVDVTDLATHMRTAAIMLTQLDGAGGSKLSKDETAAIKAKIIASMQSMEDQTGFSNAINVFNGEAGERKLENDLKTAGISSDDPSAANLGEDWASRKERIRRTSPYGHLHNWDLFSVIAKTGFDLRQEAFACQLIEAMNKIWSNAGVPAWVKKMRILITSDATGLVETITNALSIHSIKKALTNASTASGRNPKGAIASLSDYFRNKFGEPGSATHHEALQCFTRSIAAYSIICYILQIKDRHNGNILLDSHGHLIHIDFGFLLSNSPGRFGFEAAPFKFTQEYVDLMGGMDSEYFKYFRALMKQAFKALRKEAESIIILVEMMGRESTLPCFSSGPSTSLQLRQRFQLHLSDTEVDQFVDSVLIQKSVGSIYTRLYDQFQLLTQGIYS